MGPDEVFSAGLSVEVVCEGEVARAPTTTTPAPTATAAVETGVAGKAVTAEAAAAAAAAPALAFTGPCSSTAPLIGFAAFLLLGGVGLLGFRTRARD